MKLCECGCGTVVRKRFQRGHNPSGKFIDAELVDFMRELKEYHIVKEQIEKRKKMLEK